MFYQSLVVDKKHLKYARNSFFILLFRKELVPL